MSAMVEFESIRIRYSDHYEAYGRLWLPPSPRGSVLYLHGIQSHGGWFEASARAMVEAGYAVLLPDRRGSGRNEVDRGHAPSAKRLLRDTVECLNELHVRTGLERSHVVGVSWGGKVALSMQRYQPSRLASVTLVAPGLFPQVDLPTSQKAKVVWSCVTRGRTLFDIPLRDPELFTANPDRQRYIREDKLSLHKTTSGFLMASRKLDRYALSVARVSDGVPIKLFLAGEDRIINNDRTRAFVEGLSWPRVEVTAYPGAHHTLEFETDPTGYFKDAVTWLNSIETHTGPET